MPNMVSDGFSASVAALPTDTNYPLEIDFRGCRISETPRTLQLFGTFWLLLGGSFSIGSKVAKMAKLAKRGVLEIAAETHLSPMAPNWYFGIDPKNRHIPPWVGTNSTESLQYGKKVGFWTPYVFYKVMANPLREIDDFHTSPKSPFLATVGQTGGL